MRRVYCRVVPNGANAGGSCVHRADEVNTRAEEYNWCAVRAGLVVGVRHRLGGGPLVHRVRAAPHAVHHYPLRGVQQLQVVVAHCAAIRTVQCSCTVTVTRRASRWARQIRRPSSVCSVSTKSTVPSTRPLHCAPSAARCVTLQRKLELFFLCFLVTFLWIFQPQLHTRTFIAYILVLQTPERRRTLAF